jgi:hypothetical protein
MWQGLGGSGCAFSRPKAAPPRLATLAVMSSSSAEARLLSSRVANAFVWSALKRPTRNHTRDSTSTATRSQPTSTANCHGATRAAATPTSRPTAAEPSTRRRCDCRHHEPPWPPPTAPTPRVRRTPPSTIHWTAGTADLRPAEPADRDPARPRRAGQVPFRVEVIPTGNARS